MYRFMNNLVQLTLQQCNPQSNSGDFTFCFNYCHNKPKIVLKSVQQKHYLTYDKQEAKRFKTDSNLTINSGTTTPATTTTNTNNIAERRFIKNKQVNRRRNNNNNNNKLNSTSNIKVIMCYIFCFIIFVQVLVKFNNSFLYFFFIDYQVPIRIF